MILGRGALYFAVFVVGLSRVCTGVYPLKITLSRVFKVIQKTPKS